MSDLERNESEQFEQSEQSGQPTYQPASFQKRVIAWVGVAYMVILVLSTTYMMATARTLSGTAGLLVCPAAAGAAVIAIHRYRAGEMKVDNARNFTIALVFLCFVAFVMGLVCGGSNLIAHLEALFA